MRRQLLCRLAVVVVTLALALAPASAQSQTSDRAYMKPVLADGKTFPVLLPIDGRWLNWRDTFGAPRMRLVGGVWQQVGIHQGIDIYAERGSPVVSMGSGVVVNVGWTFYSGWRVGVRGDDGRYYFYAHLLSSFARGVAAGSRVTAGQALGYLGSSGYGPEGTAEEFAPHLHFGLQERGGRWGNPQEMLEDLYQVSAAHLAGARERMVQANLRAEVLRSRAYLPGAPPTEALMSAVDEAVSERASVATSIRWEG